MQADPLGLAPDNNDYRMEGNGPTDSVDPSGEEERILRAVPPSLIWGKNPKDIKKEKVPEDIKKEIDNVNLPLTVARSAADHAALQSDLHGRLRDLYHKLDAQIQVKAEKMLRDGKTLKEVADWRAGERNKLKTEIRRRGNALIDYYCQKTRGAMDKPTPDALRNKYTQRGMTAEEANRKIIGSKPQPKADKVAKGLKWGGRIAIVVDLSLSVYRVITAPEGEHLNQVFREGARFGGAVAGGWAGAKTGAAIGFWVGSFFPGAGNVIGAGIGGIIGGIGGAVAGGWAAEKGVDSILEKG